MGPTVYPPSALTTAVMTNAAAGTRIASRVSAIVANDFSALTASGVVRAAASPQRMRLAADVLAGVVIGTPSRWVVVLAGGWHDQRRGLAAAAEGCEGGGAVGCRGGA